MKCPMCGMGILEGDTYCSNCGTIINKAKIQKASHKEFWKKIRKVFYVIIAFSAIGIELYDLYDLFYKQTLLEEAVENYDSSVHRTKEALPYYESFVEKIDQSETNYTIYENYWVEEDILNIKLSADLFYSRGKFNVNFNKNNDDQTMESFVIYYGSPGGVDDNVLYQLAVINDLDYNSLNMMMDKFVQDSQGEALLQENNLDNCNIILSFVNSPTGKTTTLQVTKEIGEI